MTIPAARSFPISSSSAARVDDHAVAEEAELVGMDDAGGNEPECEVLVGELHRMAGVVAALIARHYVECSRRGGRRSSLFPRPPTALR